MAVLPIREFKDPSVRTKALKVEQIDESIKDLVKNMVETMRASAGVGLAAPQIGVLKRVIVVSRGENEGHVAYINPEIITASGEVVEEEGCLSVPNVRVNVKRAQKIKVRALDIEGKKVEFEAEGFFARVIQHEIDHLNGVLIIDRADKNELKRVLQKLAES